jgi:hypothetical protein
MTLNAASGLLTTTPFDTSGTDCDAAFWTNLPPNACRIVVTGTSIPDADGVAFYFAEPQPCCEITCPTNVTVTTCGTNALVFYPAPVTSNCGFEPITICNPPSGSSFPLGTNIVTCSVLNSGGVITSCEFNVIVLQSSSLPPWTVICPEFSASVNVTGCPPVMPDLSSFITIVTNCTLSCPPIVTQSIPAGTPLTAGNHVAIVNICDCLTNCAVCDIAVNAYATGGNPTITCPPNQTVITCGTNAVVKYKVTATGHTGVVSCTPPSGSTFPLGTTWVTCTATNACGGIATCYFSVTVKPPLTRWPCDWQVGIGIPFEPVGGATTALKAVGPGGPGYPAVCFFPNPGNPSSGALLHLGQAKVLTFTTELDFMAPEGAGVDLVLPPGTMNTNNTPILSFRKKSGPGGYCVKTNKKFADDPAGLFRSIAVNTNGHLLDSFTFNAAEALTNDTLVIGYQPGVSNCHVTVELNLVDGSMSIEFDGPVVPAAGGRKGWDGCIYGPDRPVKKPKQTARVYVTPPVSPGQTPITELYLHASGLPEFGVEEPSVATAAKPRRRWGDGHVTLMKAYDDGGMEFAAPGPGGAVQVNLGRAESFDLRLTKFETNALPGEELLTRTLGPIRGLTNRPSPPFLDALLLTEHSGGVECSADFSNMDSPTVHVLILSNNVVVAERTGVPAQLGQVLFTLSTWPERLGKLGGATPCRRGKGPMGLVMLPDINGTGVPEEVTGDEFRVLAELAPGAPTPDFYEAFEFLPSEGGDWGVTELDIVPSCVPEPMVITRSGGNVIVTWSGEGFALQGAEQATGPWYDLGAGSPVNVPASSSARFFRLVCD